jgi:hypothetical protein
MIDKKNTGKSVSDFVISQYDQNSRNLSDSTQPDNTTLSD